MSIWPIFLVEIHVISSFVCFRSEEHTSELQSLRHLVCRRLLGKKQRLDASACPKRVLSIILRLPRHLTCFRHPLTISLTAAWWAWRAPVHCTATTGSNREMAEC